MHTIDGMKIDEIVCVYLGYGDDFLECIERVAREKDIRAGAVLSAIGTFDRARIHYIKHTEFPAEDVYVEKEGPMELVSVCGIFSGRALERRPHPQYNTPQLQAKG